jgi:deoxyribodipyrimidine photolyase
MGRPFQEKYADVQWESNPEHFEAWRSGRTGVPIVDAAVRQANTMGAIPCHRRKAEADSELRHYRLDAQSRPHGCRNVPDERSHD